MNGPQDLAFSSPRISVRYRAEILLSRHQTIVWFSITLTVRSPLSVDLQAMNRVRTCPAGLPPLLSAQPLLPQIVRGRMMAATFRSSAVGFGHTGSVGSATDPGVVGQGRAKRAWRTQRGQFLRVPPMGIEHIMPNGSTRACVWGGTRPVRRRSPTHGSRWW